MEKSLFKKNVKYGVKKMRSVSYTVLDEKLLSNLRLLFIYGPHYNIYMIYILVF